VSLLIGPKAASWVCDYCRVDGLPGSDGWEWDDRPGGPHHFCPACVAAYGIDVGTPDEWERRWAALYEPDEPGAP
jgi:hypothetical protein